MSIINEAAFETALEHSLLSQGYTPLPRDLYDRDRALFPQTILEFIKTTQRQTWDKLEALHGDKTGERILLDLNSWLDSQGTLSTLRHGFKCYGRTLRLAYFKAAHSLNPDVEARYAQNKLGITRQLRYSSNTD